MSNISKFVFTDIKDPFNIYFRLENSHPSIANSIRRLILSDVETIGFKTEPLEETEVIILKNTTSLHNEFLLHRIGMIPINFPNVSKFNPNRYKFILDVQNDSSKILDVTTSDFQVFDTELNEGIGDFIDSEQFFPKNKQTGEYILITKLKPNLSGDGEKLHLEAKGFKGSGKINSRYQPTCVSVYKNTLDDTLLVTEKQKFLDNKKAELGEKFESNKEHLMTEFDVSHADRCFLTDENMTPNTFDFNIESIGVIESGKILDESLKILSFKLGKMNQALQNLKNNKYDIRIGKSDTLMNAYDLTIPNENHTLGFLLQSFMEKEISKDVVTFVGYYNPHPLKNYIILRVAVVDNEETTVVSNILEVIKIINTHIDSLRKNISTTFDLGVKTIKL